MSKVSKEWHIYHRRHLELPLRQGPVKFAVTMPGGTTSNLWRVWTEKSGDAYVCCRDNMREIKISLHSSGKQHIAFREETGVEMTPGSRYWNQWREPVSSDPATPTLRLVFPPWGVRLTEKDRNKTPKIRRKWEDNHILIDGDDELLVVVYLLFVDEGKELRLTGDYPSSVIAILPLRPGKKLLVVAGKRPEGEARARVERALANVNPEHAKGLLSCQEKGDVPVACLTGDNPDGSAYMVVVPVRAGMRDRAC